jgi:hypothetical protein
MRTRAHDAHTPSLAMYSSIVRTKTSDDKTPRSQSFFLSDGMRQLGSLNISKQDSGCLQPKTVSPVPLITAEREKKNTRKKWGVWGRDRK